MRPKSKPKAANPHNNPIAGPSRANREPVSTPKQSTASTFTPRRSSRTAKHPLDSSHSSDFESMDTGEMVRKIKVTCHCTISNVTISHLQDMSRRQPRSGAQTQGRASKKLTRKSSAATLDPNASTENPSEVDESALPPQVGAEEAAASTGTQDTAESGS